MFRSQPISMIQENKQLSMTKLAICYMYSVAGVHNLTGTSTGQTGNALELTVYGIDKTGNRTAIAFIPLITLVDYQAMTFAASVVIGIPVADFPSIYWTYDMSTSPDFVKIVGQPIMFAEVREYPDILDITTYTVAT